MDMAAASTQIDPRTGSLPAFKLPVLNTRLQVAWAAIVVATIVFEVVPAHFPPAVFYSYKLMKCVLFLALGYLTPLTFWRFDSLNFGLLLAGLSAASVELLQGIIGNGHSFSWIELVAKLAIILFGFVLALDARYEREVRLGRFRVRLVSDHLPKY
jgi:hypothetical protein